MATYAIGDVQGCFNQLQNLLVKLQFDKSHDVLWFAGDLVNRGPESLETLRFIRSLGNAAKIVLGNHDLHLLAVYYDAHTSVAGDSLDAILKAEDAPELIDWLRHQPLAYYDAQYHSVMVHAGIPSMWTYQQTCEYAKEIETHLREDNPKKFLRSLYGNTPDTWDENLQGADRTRAIVNYLTRMRLCDANGKLDLTHKGAPNTTSKAFKPWFEWPRKAENQLKILFGHWAALKGKCDTPNIIALDGGCVWGGQLIAYCLETGRTIGVG